MSKYVVRAINIEGIENMDYLSVYGDCPESFTDRKDAEAWADKLNESDDWPEGNPGYEVVEVTD